MLCLRTPPLPTGRQARFRGYSPEKKGRIFFYLTIKDIKVTELMHKDKCLFWPLNLIALPLEELLLRYLAA